MGLSRAPGPLRYVEMPENAVGVGDAALDGPLRTEMDIMVQDRDLVNVMHLVLMTVQIETIVHGHADKYNHTRLRSIHTGCEYRAIRGHTEVSISIELWLHAPACARRVA